MDPIESQRILNNINRDREYAGWLGFAIGVLLTSLLFILVFIPMAEQGAKVEYARDQARSSNTDS